MSDAPVRRHVPAGEARSVEMLPGVVRRTLGYGDRMLLCEISLRQGSFVPLHSHPHEQIGYLAKGRIEFSIAGETVLVGVGDGYAIPGDVMHSARALEDSVAIEVFSPVREEYK